MMTRAVIRLILVTGWACSAAGFAPAAERSYPLDCWPDRLVEWQPVAADPLSLFGAPYVPGTVLGPPGDSLPFEGAFTGASLGYGGRATVAFDDLMIEDGPGPDFIVFENAFFKLPLPTTPDDEFLVFAEPAYVDVSADGVQWHRFPHDAAALQEVSAQPGDGSIGGELALRLRGLAGITPTFTGNWTVADDPAVFDPAGEGGVSGAGGDAFDLADVGLTEARFVRITDAGTLVGFPGPGEGFDLDAVVVLHGRPMPPLATDGDGDGLSDLEEARLYASLPHQPDSDGDGVDDERDVARCRDPNSFDAAPWRHFEPRLWLTNLGPCHDVRWTFLGTGVTYDLLRGETAGLADSGAFVDLGAVECLVSGATAPRWSCDGDALASGVVRFFLVRVTAADDYGRSSRLEPRTAPVGCP